MGMRAVLVLTGYGRQELEKLPSPVSSPSKGKDGGGGGPLPDYVAEDLSQAARWIIMDARG